MNSDTCTMGCAINLVLELAYDFYDGILEYGEWKVRIRGW